MDITRLKEQKKLLGYTNKDVAELSGVPLGTVQKIFGSSTKEPRRETVIALAKVLDPEMACRLQGGGSVVREAQASYDAVAVDPYNAYKYNKDKEEGTRFGIPIKQQGEYTLEDYYNIPDEWRVELIDGVIYNMTAPATYHQIVAGEVHHQMLTCAEKHNLECMPFVSPVDVQLDCDDKTMVEPDVVILCDLGKLYRKCIYGAPDFVMEVLSPSTRSKDQILKLKKYKEAGCREYWIVDIDNRSVTLFFFEDEKWPVHYSFDDKVPIKISDGMCEIDFSVIDKRLEMVGAYED